jgi:hypothetical protein
MWDVMLVSFPYMLWVLLPLIPSILIFLIFPGTTVSTEGPLAGLSVRASGAFAGYLIIFAAISYPILKSIDIITDFQQRFWTVDGYIELVDANGKRVPPQNEYLKRLIVTTKPEPHTISSDFILLRIVEGQTKRLPRISVAIPGFGEETIDLNSAQEGVKKDLVRKTITFSNPVRIRANEAFPLSP